jgi:hypothetical protein
VVVQQAGIAYNELYFALSEVEVYNAVNNIAPEAEVFSTMPEMPDFTDSATDPVLTDAKGGLDGNPDTYWMVQTVSNGRAQLIVDLGDETSIAVMEVRWATVNGTTYSATQFHVYGGLTPVEDEMEELDFSFAFLESVKRFTVFKTLRYVLLDVSQILQRDTGYLALEDLIILKTSPNLVTHLNATANASTEWANCPTCVQQFDFQTYNHGSHAAVDGDLSTWWGAPLGVPLVFGTYLEIQMASLVEVDVVAVWWQYPAADVRIDLTLTLASEGLQSWEIIQSNVDNLAYKTTYYFPNTFVIGGFRMYVSDPRIQYVGESVIGIKELQLFSVGENLAALMPIDASDGSDPKDAVDVSLATKWFSLSSAATNLTVDLIHATSMWAIRTLFPSNMIPYKFDVASSMDGVEFTVIESYTANEERDVYTLVDNIVARYIRVILLGTTSTLYSVRNIGVYNSPNLALNQVSDAPHSWYHSSYQAVDGDDSTFWTSEPLATSAKIRVDLGDEIFVGGGIEIYWKFPASSFSLHICSNLTIGDWRQLESYLTDNVTEMGNVTRYEDFFLARYVELRMEQAPVVEGDIMFAIFSFNVIFDTNLAHFKTINASHTIDTAQFGEQYAADEDLLTFWMPEQGPEVVSISFDLEEDSSISGVSVFWQFPPLSYRVMAYHNGSNEWFQVEQWDTPDPTNPEDPNVGLTQKSDKGFEARILTLEVLERCEFREGTLVALSEFALAVADGSESIAQGRAANSSDGVDGQIYGNRPSCPRAFGKGRALDGPEQLFEGSGGWVGHRGP